MKPCQLQSIRRKILFFEQISQVLFILQLANYYIFTQLIMGLFIIIQNLRSHKLKMQQDIIVPRSHPVLSDHMTVIALVNGMIGGIILVMPIMALRSGYIMIAPVVLVSGFFSFYSSMLCVRHLRNYKDLDQAVLRHFQNNKKFKIFYDACIAISLVVLLILYFDLICKQWEGLTTDSHLIPILNVIFLFPVVYVMKKYHFGASLLAYGIVSTIGYCCFLLYMLVNAPDGDREFKPVNKYFPQLAAALSQGFAIQAFFIPILKQNPNTRKYKKILIITYLIGGLIYAFIGYGGSLSILNKSYPGSKKPQTIIQYFTSEDWQVVLVQIIYLVHLYSAFPQFLLISKKRVFSIFDWPQQSDVTFKQVIYTGLIILLCLIIKMTSLTAQTLIQLNGSVVSFIFIVVIPVGLHVKCVYFTPAGCRHHKWQDQIQSQKQKQKQKVPGGIHIQQQIHRNPIQQNKIQEQMQSSKNMKKQYEIQFDQIKQQKQKQKKISIAKSKSKRQTSQGQLSQKQPHIELQQIQYKIDKQNNNGNNKNDGHQAQSSPDSQQVMTHNAHREQDLQHEHHEHHHHHHATQTDNPTVPSQTNPQQQEIKQCDIEYKSRLHQGCELMILSLMVMSGVLTMGYTIYLIAQDKDDTTLL